jgi:hypothetical protein
MTDALPSPLVPPDTDLRSFPYTPIYRARLFGSSFNSRATDAEWRAGVTLWLKSQDQVPAGSLPDDDIDLCRLADLGRETAKWKKLRAGALRGWIKCSDGRLYHPVVAEIVNEQCNAKISQSQRTLMARIAALEKRLKNATTENVKADLQSMLLDLRQQIKGTTTAPVAGSVSSSVTETNRIEGNRIEGKEESTEAPSPVPRAHAEIDDRTKSRPFIEAFDQALVEIFGEAHRRNWAQSADWVHAERLRAAGWSPETCKPVFIKSLQQKKEAGQKPPGGLAWFAQRFAELTPGDVKPPPNPDAERIEDQHCRMLEAWANLPDGARRKTPQPTREDAEKAVAERRKGAA